MLSANPVLKVNCNCVINTKLIHITQLCIRISPKIRIQLHGLTHPQIKRAAHCNQTIIKITLFISVCACLYAQIQTIFVWPQNPNRDNRRTPIYNSIMTVARRNYAQFIYYFEADSSSSLPCLANYSLVVSLREVVEKWAGQLSEWERAFKRPRHTNSKLETASRGHMFWTPAFLWRRRHRHLAEKRFPYAFAVRMVARLYCNELVGELVAFIITDAQLVMCEQWAKIMGEGKWPADIISSKA